SITVRIPPTRKSLPVRSEKMPVLGSAPPAEEESAENKEGLRGFSLTTKVGSTVAVSGLTVTTYGGPTRNSVILP
ncbi:hypothetical protein Tco_0420059, partial [Tanacetum coccineum]